MELLLILIYVSICYVVFKVFKIPVNQWSLATATLGGIIGIVLLLLIMNYNHPFTKNARIYFSVTPVLPGVRGTHHRGAGASERRAQGRRCALSHRSQAL
jgi:hypothetical protein